MTTVLAFLQAIIQIPSLLERIAEMIDNISNRLDALKIEKMEKELAQYKLEVNSTLKRIENAKTAEERRALSTELANKLR